MKTEQVIMVVCLTCLTLDRPGSGGPMGHPADRTAGEPASPSGLDDPRQSAEPVRILMRGVDLHLSDAITLHVRHLAGLLVSRTNRPPVFDDPRSYVIRMQAAEVSLGAMSLTNLLNERVLAAKRSPLRDVRVTVTPDGRLSVKGTLHKGISVPFSCRAAVATASDGRLHLHTSSIRALGVPVQGLMDLLGIGLEDVVRLRQTGGVSIEGDDLVIAPGAALPPPEIQGRIVGAVAAGQRLTLTFSDGADKSGKQDAAVPASRRHSIHFRGGIIRFGRLTMEPADLELIDADPRDAFDFFPSRYGAQLVAGYSKNTRAGGLRTFMPDYDDLVRDRPVDLRPASRALRPGS